MHGATMKFILEYNEYVTNFKAKDSLNISSITKYKFTGL